MSGESRGRWLAAGIALAAIVFLPWLYRWGLRDSALLVNDEAIYCEMAREMVVSRTPSELTYDGEPYFPRPPAALWALAVAYELGGVDPPEPPLRLVCALLPALEVALTIWLGVLLFSPYVGIVGGLLLAMSDLLVGYARAYESEPLLVCFSLGAFLAWTGAKHRRWLWGVYGVCLGGALMTKQLVGLLPLAAPLAEMICRRRSPSAVSRQPSAVSRQPSAVAVSRQPSPSPSPMDLRGLAFGLLVALLVAAPWHLLMLWRHGYAFLDSFFVHSLLVRASTNLLQHTSPAFYLAEIWKSEQAPFALAWLAGALATLVVGLRRGRASELLLGGWALGPLVLYSLARSRYDYYILICYPAFALSAAWLLDRAPLRRPLRALVAVLAIGVAALVHLPRNLVVNPGFDELRTLLASARGVPASAPLYLFGVRAYAARIYADRRVRVFVDTPKDVPAAEALRKTGMPASAELASPPSAMLELAVRPSLLLLPRARVDVLTGADASAFRVLGESKRYQLLYLP